MSKSVKPLLIFIHGFNSSSFALKPCQLSKYLKEKQCDQYCIAPDLNFQPAAAITQLEQLVEENCEQLDITLIGSSLGGYYATYLAEKYDLRVVHINPTIYPCVLLADYLGTNTNLYTKEEYELRAEHIDQLKKIEVEKVSKPEKHIIYLQTADDILDFREAAEKYKHSWVIIEQGDSHGFENFEWIILGIMVFSEMDGLVSTKP